jgi:hypothetical protein
MVKHRIGWLMVVGNPPSISISSPTIPSPCYLTEEEVTAVHALLRRKKDHLEETRNPAGYHLGVTVGTAGG